MNAPGLLATMLALALGATLAHADGGAVLLHQNATPFTLTLFAAPQPLTTGTADLSVIVQDQTTGDALLDAQVDITPQQEGTTTPQPTVRLTQQAGGNRLLQSARLSLPKPGKWQLTVHVRHGRDEAEVSTTCTVQPDTSRAALVWLYVLLPVAVILIFLLHQLLKQGQSKRLRGKESLV